MPNAGDLPASAAELKKLCHSYEKKLSRQAQTADCFLVSQDAVFQPYIFSCNFLKIAPDIARKFHVRKKTRSLRNWKTVWRTNPR